MTHPNHAANFSILIIAPLLFGLISCSAEDSANTPKQPVFAEAAGHFEQLSDPSGCSIERITTASHDQYQVQGVSSDGRFLLMAASRDGAAENDSIYEVFEMDLTSGVTTDLSDTLQNSGPFSPDGRFNVVAQPADDGKTDIYEYERATGELRAVASHENWDWLPSYSPDGQFILFNSFRVDGQSDIFLFEKSSDDLRRITKHPGYDAHAQFSADGSHIVYHRQRGTREAGGYIFDLFVYDLEAGVNSQLTDADYEESYPAWAPDGRHIVYSSDANGEPEKLNLYVLDSDSKSTVRLTKGDWKDGYAYWTRDGKHIYFNSDRAGATDIYRMPMSGIECVPVAQFDAAEEIS